MSLDSHGRRTDGRGERGRFEAAAEISDADFDAVRRFVQREIGLALSEAKKALVVSRLGSRLRALHLRSYRQYVARAESDEAERQRLIDAISTNETRFFREPAQFDFLRREVLPRWTAQPPRRLRIWSAGCSTGEEPYSIAMTLLGNLPAGEGWSFEVLATDVSARALEQAAAAIYAFGVKTEIAPEILHRFFLRGVGSREGQIRVREEVRESVRFAAVNLHRTGSWPHGPFDAIFCRNVLIYFDADSRRRVIDALLARLTPGSLLFLGHAESLNTVPGVRSLIPNVYVRTTG
ncbi:MAG TPA: protein-glutamate O-methyltransferase CheR [Thermoanaerobaculia bacterium]|nr:protein-glutamate O-methyltransferase CheR [Thermoanaerobaculia bacterium]